MFSLPLAPRLFLPALLLGAAALVLPQAAHAAECSLPASGNTTISNCHIADSSTVGIDGGNLTVNGDVTMRSGSTLIFEPGQHIDVNGTIFKSAGGAVIKKEGYSYDYPAENVVRVESYSGFPSIHAVDGNTVLVAYQEEYSPDTISDFNIKFARSDDGGQSWTRTQLHNDGVHPAVTSPDGQHIYVAYKGDGAKSLELARSTDGGSTWDKVNVANPGGFTPATSPVIVAPNSNTIYILYERREHNGSDPGNFDYWLMMAKSTNGGSSWSTKAVRGKKTDVFAQGYSVSAQSASRVFASYRDGDSGDMFARTSNGGSSWNKVQEDTVVVADNASWNTLYSLGNIDDRGADDQPLRIKKTTNGGNSWSAPPGLSSTVVANGGSSDWVAPTGVQAIDGDTAAFTFVNDSFDTLHFGMYDNGSVKTGQIGRSETCDDLSAYGHNVWYHSAMSSPNADVTYAAYACDWSGPDVGPLYVTKVRP